MANPLMTEIPMARPPTFADLLINIKPKADLPLNLTSMAYLHVYVYFWALADLHVCRLLYGDDLHVCLMHIAVSPHL